MHYIKITDNSEFFANLKRQLSSEYPSCIDDGSDFLCALNEKNINNLSSIISEYIWDVKFLDFVSKNVKHFHNCFRELDIIINTMNVANSFKETNDTVFERIKDYISNNKILNIDGFVKFRLRDFLNDFNNLLCFYDKSYDVESEYFDFICTLKECMNCMSVSSDLEIHIVNLDGVCYIFNEYGEDITEKCIKEYTFEADNDLVTRDDKIVSSLITMCPKVLHLHSNKYSGTPILYDTLKAIFACRIIVE